MREPSVSSPNEWITPGSALVKRYQQTLDSLQKDECPVSVLSALRAWFSSLRFERGLSESARLALLLKAESGAMKARLAGFKSLYQMVLHAVPKRSEMTRAFDGYYPSLYMVCETSLHSLGMDTQAGPIERDTALGFAARAMKAASEWLEVCLIDYHNLPQLQWQRCGFLFSQAQQHGLAHLPFDSAQGRVRMDEAYLQLQSLHIAGLDGLSAPQIRSSMAILRAVAGQMRLSPSASRQTTHWVGAPTGWIPMRWTGQIPKGQSLDSPQPVAFFSTLDALDAIRALQAKAVAGDALPEIADLPDAHLRQIGACAHLLDRWAPRRPLRIQKRHKSNGQMAARAGLMALTQALETDSGQGAYNLRIRDMSLGGLGLEGHGLSDHVLQIGRLVGLRAQDGRSWQVGIIQRMRRGGQGATGLGVRILSMKPRTAYLVGLDAEKVPILLCQEGAHNPDRARLIAPPHIVLGQPQWHIEDEGQRYTFVLEDEKMAGMDFQVQCIRMKVAS
jgi:hypothetical protein